MKQKTIKLSDGWADIRDRTRTRYRVEQITDSIEYATGDLLDRDVVARLCVADEWRVTVVPKK
jgi:hypothetical protein